MLTLSSVVCADRIVAVSSWNGVVVVRAQSSFAVPGYSRARRSAVARAALGDRGRAMAAGHYRPVVAPVMVRQQWRGARPEGWTVAAVAGADRAWPSGGRPPRTGGGGRGTAPAAGRGRGLRGTVGARLHEGGGATYDDLPRRTTATAPAAATFTLVATGDVLLHSPLWRQAEADAAAAGQPGPGLPAAHRRHPPLVEGADLAICHLETPSRRRGPSPGYPSFSVPPEIGAGPGGHRLRRLHHGLQPHLRPGRRRDRPHAGRPRRRRRPRRLGPQPRRRPRPSPSSTPARRVALLSYTYGFNGIPRPNGEAWRSNPIDEARILADAARARGRAPTWSSWPCTGATSTCTTPTPSRPTSPRLTRLARHRPAARPPRPRRPAARERRRRVGRLRHGEPGGHPLDAGGGQPRGPARALHVHRRARRVAGDRRPSTRRCSWSGTDAHAAGRRQRRTLATRLDPGAADRLVAGRDRTAGVVIPRGAVDRRPARSPPEAPGQRAGRGWCSAGRPVVACRGCTG